MTLITMPKDPDHPARSPANGLSSLTRNRHRGAVARPSSPAIVAIKRRLPDALRADPYVHDAADGSYPDDMRVPRTAIQGVRPARAGGSSGGFAVVGFRRSGVSVSGFTVV